MKILIGSDLFGKPLREDLIRYLDELGHEVIDTSPDDDSGVEYPDIALHLAERIAEGESDRGVLICSTGIGMAIVANKVLGVRAVCAHDPYSAERARKSNDAQILTMGGQIVEPRFARIILDQWLASEFEGECSTPKVKRIKEIDEYFRKVKH